MLSRRVGFIQGWYWALLLGVAAAPSHADDWIPVTPQDLSMRKVDKAPGAAAVFLYRQVDRDDSGSGTSELTYERIKILSEEGRKYADIEIEYTKGDDSVFGIQARTIRPDGSIVKFDGQIFDRSIVKGSGIKVNAKTFTLPEVQVGSIIEYRYHHEYRRYTIFDSHWILSEPLFTQQAKFSLLRYPQFELRWAWAAGLPDGAEPPKESGGRIRMEVHDVPAFIVEEFMPPENELKYHVDFVYSDDDFHPDIKEPEKYWKKYSKRHFGTVKKYIDHERAMKAAVAQIVAPTDSPEEKLHKIYARTQKIRNLSFERQRSAEEKDREKLKDPQDAADVWEYGYGYADDITWLFLALVKTAGLDAHLVMIPTRDRHLFNAALQNPNDLNTSVVEVALDGKELFFDPGSMYASFGQLPWFETAVPGRRLDADGGQWLNTTAPKSHDSRILRKGTLQVDAHGTLSGKMTVTYTGQEALSRRMQEHGEDETDRKKYLEDQIKYDMPSGADVELVNKPDWESSSDELTAEYTLRLQGWAAAAGQRALFPVALFGAPEKGAFLHQTREHPLYFHYARQADDDITVELAPGWKVASVPAAQSLENTACGYSMVSAEEGGALHLKRSLRLDMLLVNKKYYAAIQRFYDGVRTGDEQQAVLTRDAGAKH